MKEKREFWIGEADFREIIKNNGYYVDKTLLIDNIFKEKGIKVKLFTRPRRFGKTLNLSMIRHFFNIKTAEVNKDLFKGLNIEKTETMKEFGKYPVIFLSLKDLMRDTAEENIMALRNMISSLYGENKFVKEVLEKKELEEYEAIETGREGDYKVALKNLIKYLHRYYGKEVILLIDEYDAPLIEAYTSNYYNEVINFYRIMFQGALKDAEGLKLAVLTGITRIARENIFSGLNNIQVYSVLSEDYEEFFGFTEEEVVAGIKEYEIEVNLDDIKKWYNGYNFNDKAIYNPWSIISFLRNKKLKAYWVNTSENKIIKDSLKKVANKEVLEKMETLFDGGVIKAQIDESVTFKDLKKTSELWNLMLNSGYLTVEKVYDISEGIYALRIPNYEIERFFTKAFINELVEDDREHFFEALMALREGEAEKFGKELKENVFNTVSFNEKDKEAFYHGYIVALTTGLKSTHYTKSERETGYGRFDVYVEPKKKDGFGYVIETKVIKEIKNEEKISEKLKIESELALEQIRERKYYAELVERDIENISLIGIAFYGKNVEISVEKIK